MDTMCEGELPTELSWFSLVQGSKAFLEAEDKLFSRLEQLISGTWPFHAIDFKRIPSLLEG